MSVKGEKKKRIARVYKICKEESYNKADVQTNNFFWKRKKMGISGWRKSKYTSQSAVSTLGSSGT
jgi:hypothetical protein